MRRFPARVTKKKVEHLLLAAREAEPRGNEGVGPVPLVELDLKNNNGEKGDKI